MVSYVGLGGNLEASLLAIREALSLLASLSGVSCLKTSRLYRTTPVSEIPQNAYLNAVCRLQTTLPPDTLFQKLQEIEKKMGKKAKPKNAPRLIDLDLLFYGDLLYHSKELTLPHPKWHERLFVIAPLAEVVETHFFLDIKAFKKQFKNPHQETVSLWGTV